MSSAQIELFSTSQPKECSNASMDKVDNATLKYTLNDKAYQAPNNDFQTAQYSASYTEVNLLAETYLSQSTAPLTNPLLTSKYGTELSQMISCDKSTISIYNASKPYLFCKKLPHYIDVAILEVCGFTEWTMLKRVSQFHYRNISTFIDARFLYQLERYVNEGIPLFQMLDNTRSLIAGQFLLKGYLASNTEKKTHDASGVHRRRISIGIESYENKEKGRDGGGTGLSVSNRLNQAYSLLLQSVHVQFVECMAGMQCGIGGSPVWDSKRSAGVQHDTCEIPVQHQRKSSVASAEVQCSISGSPA
ncbi:MAG: hypothetical protein NXY57DRAFT_1043700 [Lentinula lateritia]|nr:MAG: hypothetical protein NXY57DRAFT_1043700 [Lentinula lateritia]